MNTNKLQNNMEIYIDLKKQYRHEYLVHVFGKRRKLSLRKSIGIIIYSNISTSNKPILHKDSDLQIKLPLFTKNNYSGKFLYIKPAALQLIARYIDTLIFFEYLEFIQIERTRHSELNMSKATKFFLESRKLDSMSFHTLTDKYRRFKKQDFEKLYM